MAIYCNDECKDMGGICDFCIYYQDANEDTNKGFAGEGVCTKKSIEVDACDGCDDDFHCTLVEDELS